MTEPLVGSIQPEPQGDLVRVRSVSSDELTYYIEYLNGKYGHFICNEELPWQVGPGDILIVSANSVFPAPAELWKETSSSAIVRLVLEDRLLLESGSGMTIVPTADEKYQVGNTVEVTPSGQILGLLSPTPIRYLEPPSTGKLLIERFRLSADQYTGDFADFAGQESVVARAKELIELPLARHKELAQIGARPIKGVLFTGPPGTGKTMLARIIAAQAGAEFYKISGPEVFSKWYGESEEIIRMLFEDASKQQRAIIFFDEIDSVAGQRDEDAHEASKRVVAQLLTEMDGFTRDQNIVVVAATNRPDDIDVALRRPGRFDWEIKFSLPTLEDRLQILLTTAKAIKTVGPLPHENIALKTDGWSAAELTAIWSEAALLAVSDGRAVVAAEDYVAGFDRVALQRQRGITTNVDDKQ
jgi:transitional endoplasmic reticulum ATPase